MIGISFHSLVFCFGFLFSLLFFQWVFFSFEVHSAGYWNTTVASTVSQDLAGQSLILPERLFKLYSLALGSFLSENSKPSIIANEPILFVKRWHVMIIPQEVLPFHALVVSDLFCTGCRVLAHEVNIKFLLNFHISGFLSTFKTLLYFI